MAELTPEERRRIYEEEKTRIQARAVEKARQDTAGCLGVVVVFVILVLFIWAIHGSGTASKSDTDPSTSAPSSTTQSTEAAAPPPDPGAAPQAGDTDPSTSADAPSRAHHPVTAVAPADDPAVHAYCEQIASISENIKEALELFSKQNDAAGRDASLIYTDDWKLQTALACSGLKEYAKEILAITDVPPVLHRAHRLLTRMAHKLLQTVDEYARGVDEQDVSAIESSAQTLNAVRSLGERAAREIMRVRGSE